MTTKTVEDRLAEWLDRYEMEDDTELAIASLEKLLRRVDHGAYLDGQRYPDGAMGINDTKRILAALEEQDDG